MNFPGPVPRTWPTMASAFVGGDLLCRHGGTSRLRRSRLSCITRRPISKKAPSPEALQVPHGPRPQKTSNKSVLLTALVNRIFAFAYCAFPKASWKSLRATNPRVGLRKFSQRMDTAKWLRSGAPALYIVCKLAECLSVTGAYSRLSNDRAPRISRKIGATLRTAP